MSTGKAARSCFAGMWRGASRRSVAALTALLLAVVMLAAASRSAQAQAQARETAQELVFSMNATDDCIADVGHPGTVGQCIGQSAALCMEQNAGGETTIGMTACLGRELAVWDERLNAAHAVLMKQARAADRELDEPGASAPRAVPALRAMQRSWIAFRDARCSFEAALWSGGTGAGPAFLQCRMEETGRQTLYLQKMGEDR